MGHPPLEKLLPKANFSIYRLVRMAARRATELADGAAKLIPTSPEEKTATTSLEEIHAGKVVLVAAADKFKPSPATEISAEEQV